MTESVAKRKSIKSKKKKKKKISLSLFLHSFFLDKSNFFFIFQRHEPAPAAIQEEAHHVLFFVLFSS